MPVENHPVHSATVQKAGALYGCHSLDRNRKPILVKAGYTKYGEQLWCRIDDFGSKECRYDKSLTDNKCRDCQHRGSGEAYFRKVNDAANNKG